MTGSRSRLSRRSFLGSSMLFVGGAAVAACTSDPTGSGDTAAKGKVTLNHWYHEYGEAGTKDAATRYAKTYTRENPNVAVKVTWVPGDYKTKWQSAVLTPEGPDVYEINEVTPDMVAQRQVASLDDVMGPIKAQYNEAALKPLTHSGKIYGIPMIIDVMLLWYRKSLLDAAGVKPPTTLDELVAAAKKLTRGKTKGLFLGNDGTAGVRDTIAFSTGQTFLDDRKASYATPQIAAALGKVHQLHTDKSVLLGYPTEWYDPSAFTSGAAAMVWGGLWALPKIKEQLKDDFGVVPWPSAGPGGKPVVILGGWSQVVNGKSKQVEEAKKYAQWLWARRGDIQKDWAVSYGFHVPPRSVPAEAATELREGTAKTVVDLLGQYGVRNTANWAPEVRKPFEDALSDIVKKGTDPARTLADAAARSQAALDKLPRV